MTSRRRASKKGQFSFIFLSFLFATLLSAAITVFLLQSSPSTRILATRPATYESLAARVQGGQNDEKDSNTTATAPFQSRSPPGGRQRTKKGRTVSGKELEQALFAAGQPSKFLSRPSSSLKYTFRTIAGKEEKMCVVVEETQAEEHGVREKKELARQVKIIPSNQAENGGKSIHGVNKGRKISLEQRGNSAVGHIDGECLSTVRGFARIRNEQGEYTLTELALPDSRRVDLPLEDVQQLWLQCKDQSETVWVEDSENWDSRSLGIPTSSLSALPAVAGVHVLAVEGMGVDDLSKNEFDGVKAYVEGRDDIEVVQMTAVYLPYTDAAANIASLFYADNLDTIRSPQDDRVLGYRTKQAAPTSSLNHLPLVFVSFPTSSSFLSARLHHLFSLPSFPDIRSLYERLPVELEDEEVGDTENDVAEIGAEFAAVLLRLEDCRRRLVDKIEADRRTHFSKDGDGEFSDEAGQKPRKGQWKIKGGNRADVPLTLQRMRREKERKHETAEKERAGLDQQKRDETTRLSKYHLPSFHVSVFSSSVSRGDPTEQPPSTRRRQEHMEQRWSATSAAISAAIKNNAEAGIASLMLGVSNSEDSHFSSAVWIVPKQATASIESLKQLHVSAAQNK
mmetsp:Transcript_30146/g.77868  ORF Transcript_30146/g.77868 Transcript_30146/m.77868 type:complete len:623 (-) Transcript_30146:1766-3634(-)